MTFHYDTNVAIGIIGRPGYRARHDSLAAGGERACVSSIVLFELWFGVARSNRFERNAGVLRSFLSLVDVLAFSDDAAIAAGELRATLKAAGTPIGPYDLLIAAHAVRLGATLVTANMREFSRVPGLKLENWTR